MRHITTTISGTRNMNITQWQCSLDPWLRSTALHTDWYTLYSSNIHCSSLKRQDQNVLYHTTAMLALLTSTGLKLLNSMPVFHWCFLHGSKLNLSWDQESQKKLCSSHNMCVFVFVCVCCVCVCGVVLCYVVCMCTYGMLASSIIHYCITFKFTAES